jgi:hypothetical protein
MQIIIEDSIPTAEKIHCVCITKINRYMVFREITSVYSENSCGQCAKLLNVKAGGFVVCPVIELHCIDF